MKSILITILLIYSATSYASQMAITDTGEEVILNDDGTWQYSDSGRKTTATINTNKQAFKKPGNASFLLKSVINNTAYWINTNKWSFKKATGNSEAEYEFKLKGKDLYAMTVAEEVEISIESLADIALDNAKSAAADARVIKKEFRMVNGKKVIYMEMRGTIQSIKFTYLGYYSSDASGSTQLLVYTATNLVNKYKSEIDNLLNGLITR